MMVIMTSAVYQDVESKAIKSDGGGGGADAAADTADTVAGVLIPAMVSVGGGGCGGGVERCSHLGRFPVVVVQVE